MFGQNRSKTNRGWVNTAEQRIGELLSKIEYLERDLIIANEATVRAENDAKEAREKQLDVEKELTLLKSSIAQRNLEDTVSQVEAFHRWIPHGYSMLTTGSNFGPPPPVSTPMPAEKEAELKDKIAELNSKIAGLEEDKREIAKKFGIQIPSLNNAIGKFQQGLQNCQEQLKKCQRLLVPFVKLAELAETCKVKQLESISITDELIAEADLICFSLAALDLERGSESLVRGDLNLGSLSIGPAITKNVGLSAARETPKLDDSTNVITEEEINELEALLLSED